VKRRSPGAATAAAFAPEGTRLQTDLPQLPEPTRRSANNPEIWDALMRELDADFA